MNDCCGNGLYCYNSAKKQPWGVCRVCGMNGETAIARQTCREHFVRTLRLQDACPCHWAELAQWAQMPAQPALPTPAPPAFPPPGFLGGSASGAGRAAPAGGAPTFIHFAPQAPQAPQALHAPPSPDFGQMVDRANARIDRLVERIQQLEASCGGCRGWMLGSKRVQCVFCEVWHVSFMHCHEAVGIPQFVQRLERMEAVIERLERTEQVVQAGCALENLLVSL